MPYKYLDDLAIADAAFEAWGSTLEEMFAAASDALINVMAGNLDAIEPREFRRFRFEDIDIDMLLFQVLQELIYYKDAEQLLLRVRNIRVDQLREGFAASIEAAGEPISADRHDLIVDVKAVTLYRFQVERTLQGWKATVVVDT